MTRIMFLLGFAALGVSAFAKDKVAPVFANGRGVAVNGYDVVAYHEENKPVKGDAKFTHEWNGAKWMFATEASLGKFKADPAKYAPQYGGYCAWAVGHGYTAPTDPAAFTIVDGKLYLNYNKDVSAKWNPEKAKWIAEGDQHWPGLHK